MKIFLLPGFPETGVLFFWPCVNTLIGELHKINGAILIHVKLKAAQKLMILNCFIILYVEILSGLENWDIQHLIFRKYDTIKTCCFFP